jgi:serine protease
MKHRQYARSGQGDSGKTFRAVLGVEQLEDRNLLDASPVAGLELPPVAQIALVPNDPSFSTQWGLDYTGSTTNVDINAPQAWDVTTGTARTIVGVIDTGIDYRHIDLYRNIWLNENEIPADIRGRLIDTDGDGIISFWDLNDSRNQGAGKITDLDGDGRITGADVLKSRAQGGWADGVDSDGNGYKDDLIGWDFVNNDNDPYDDNGHGTHVSGIIGATGNDGVGVAGLNWKIRLIPLKFLNSSGSGSLDKAVEALNYAVAEGATISNNSWTAGGANYQPLLDAINAARAQGHLFVTAAGNGGSDGKGDDLEVSPSYPASYTADNIVAVAATGKGGGLTVFSDYGAQTVDLAAPGLNIPSTWKGNSYRITSGTSMATPFVTGTLALLRGLRPDWTYAQLINQVLSTVDQTSALTGKLRSGGRLDAGRALTQAAQGLFGAQVVSVTPDASGADPVSSVRVVFSDVMDPSSVTLDRFSLTGPRGTILIRNVQVVAGSGNKVFDVFFDTQKTAGVYQFTVAPNVRDAQGNLLDQDQDGVSGETTDDRYSSTFTISSSYSFTAKGPLPITDFHTTVLSLTITQDIRIEDLNVKIHLSHLRDSDLVVRLRGPDGTEVLLAYREGGDGQHYFTTLFDDEADTPIQDGIAPFRGTYRPEGPLSAFDGKNALGTWQLLIEDQALGMQGTLHFFTLTITSPPPGSGATASMAGVAGVAEAEVEASTASVAGSGKEASAIESGVATGRAAPSEATQNPLTGVLLHDGKPVDASHLTREERLENRPAQSIGLASGQTGFTLDREAIDLLFSAVSTRPGAGGLEDGLDRELFTVIP